MTERRLKKAERREQLLDAAMTLVRREGVDRLTLARVAEEAGVTKPVVYEHFGDRNGLLLALYAAFDQTQVAELRQALAGAEPALPRISAVIAAAYMHCYADTTGEWHAIRGALAGSEDMNAVHARLLDGYVDLFRDAFAPFAQAGDSGLRDRCIGLVGAAEALSAAMTRGDLDEARAARTLDDLIRTSVVRA